MKPEARSSGAAALASARLSRIPNGSAGGARASRRTAVTKLAEAELPTRFGTFRIMAFEAPGSHTEVVALVYGDPGATDRPLVRLHSECLTGEALGSLRCDCGEQLHAALQRIAASGDGVLLYLRQEGRGIGIVDKLRAYALQDAGLDTVEANLALGLPVDAREYSSAAAVLRAMGIGSVRLLTNNPAKAAALDQHGVPVVERIPLEVAPNATNLQYLLTKAVRMGHMLTAVPAAHRNGEGGLEAGAAG